MRDYQRNNRNGFVKSDIFHCHICGSLITEKHRYKYCSHECYLISQKINSKKQSNKRKRS